MKSHNSHFDEQDALHSLKHYLPAQAALKDFVHHNTLHAFQNQKFHDALRNASERFGFKVSLSLEDYRAQYKAHKIREDILDRIIIERKGKDRLDEWKHKLLYDEFNDRPLPRLGRLRANWKRVYRVDLDSLVHPLLFRILCSYLDQGISIWNFPVWNLGFLDSLKEMESKSKVSFFRTARAKEMFLSEDNTIEGLLKILVGDSSLYKQYLFDQQFAHQGWSGMVSMVENEPHMLLDQRIISLHDLVIFELLLEIDALDFEFGPIWSPLAFRIAKPPENLFEEIPLNDRHEVLNIWQDAMEWTYYNPVLTGLQLKSSVNGSKGMSKKPSFQAVFCIDDREISLRRYLEHIDPLCETLSTPGFFSVEFYFQPVDGKFYTKQCPAPITPKYLIKEVGSQGVKRTTDVHFTKGTHTLFRGWLISQTLGFWSAFRLFINIFSPSISPATASSFRHMDKVSKLTIENTGPDEVENGLQIGYTLAEMTDRLEGLLKSIGLLDDFAPIVYMVGHGSSSVNNPYYAAYDCGACSGRPGSVNARVICYIANHPQVRKNLVERGIHIPDNTQFIGGLHDTSSDEIAFYDEELLTPHNLELHKKNVATFHEALDYNSKERSRRFMSVNMKLSPKQIHKQIRKRVVSLFEPRPEYNHATNTLCIVGRRELTKKLFFDRRAFLNSYNYSLDMDGKYLFNILKPAAPVCGGINLEYFFSRVDNQKLGAGSKLPHNVMGLIGVANGIDGDLRPGLPAQMIEIHDPIRLMIIVEHFPKVVLDVIQRTPELYEWFINYWVHLVVIDPETHKLHVFKEGQFIPYETNSENLQPMGDMMKLAESSRENLPVLVLN